MFEAAAALAETGQRDQANALWTQLIEADPGGDLAPLARRNLQSLEYNRDRARCADSRGTGSASPASRFAAGIAAAAWHGMRSV